MPKPGYLPGHRTHTHTVTVAGHTHSVTIDLPAHTHGGVTSGTESTESYDFEPVTVSSTSVAPAATVSSEKG